MFIYALFIIFAMVLYSVLNMEYKRQKRLCWPQTRAIFLDDDLRLSTISYDEVKREKYYTNYLRKPYRYVANGHLYENRHIERKRKVYTLPQSQDYIQEVLKRSNSMVRFNPEKPQESYLIMDDPYFGWPMVSVFVLTLIILLSGVMVMKI
ncbi:MAG: hypothetical protein AAFY36_09585 [Bacteroidota bacterium]